jgi:hypothetical protein
MKKLFCLPSLALPFALPFALPLALLPLTSAFAETLASESRTIDANVQKIMLDGVVNVTIKQGATASLVVHGEKDQLALITTSQSGDVLRIGSENHRTNKAKLRAEVTIPQLQEFIANGVGKSEVSGFTGESLRLDLKGAGSISFQGSYKDFRSHLSGVGSMTLNLSNNDNTDFKLSGLGSAVLKGQGKKLRADLSGLGSLDAEHFNADALDLRVKGMGSATAYAKQTATVNLAGMGSATIYGSPQTRNANRSGMGSITWKE